MRHPLVFLALNFEQVQSAFIDMTQKVVQDLICSLKDQVSRQPLPVLLYGDLQKQCSRVTQDVLLLEDHSQVFS